MDDGISTKVHASTATEFTQLQPKEAGILRETTTIDVLYAIHLVLVHVDLDESVRRIFLDHAYSLTCDARQQIAA